MQGPLYFWSYVYYLSKYYELLDTVILALKVPLVPVLASPLPCHHPS
jgi:hypothetical protein